MKETWRDIAARKQAERHSRIPKEWLLPTSIDLDQDSLMEVPRQSGLLSPTELRITEQYDATALLEELAKGRLTSKAVTIAFCKRAAIAQQLTNCLTEIMFEDAISRSKELDDHLAQTGKPKGPLHGLPISLKDTFKIKGYDASIGLAALSFQPSASNSALVDQLFSLGAVLHCKTSIPQTMMALDSHNNVFGRVRNPAHKNLTAGGSSGGEGAVIAMRGSILGVGTDVGGSIRVPALCNGLYAVKPSHGRVPYADQEGGLLPGSSKLAIEATAGPIAHSLRDCDTLLEAIGDHEPWNFDPDVISQSWTQQSSLSSRMSNSSGHGKPPLIVGVVRTDGHVTPLPPVQRLIGEVASSLRSSRGLNSTPIEVVELDLTGLLSQCLKVANGIFSLDGANRWLDLLEATGEPLSPWLANRIRRRPQKSVDEIRKLQGQKLDLQNRALGIWRESGGFWRTASSSQSQAQERKLDVLICPAAPHPIPPIDRWNDVNYTAAFNLLDLPAGVLPVRLVSKDDLRGEVASGKELNGWDKYNRGLWGEQEKKLYEGTMLSVQVVGPRLGEKSLVQAMSIIDQVLKLGSGKSVKSKL